MSNDESQPQRSATRAPVDRPVRLLFDDSLEPEVGLCGDISIGGMFVLTEAGRPAGSLARFELMLPEQRVVRGLGEVVWSRSAPERVEKSAMGIRFRFLEQRDRQMIFKLVSQHIKDRLASKRPGELPAHAPPELPADLPAPPLPASAFAVPPPPSSGPLAGASIAATVSATSPNESSSSMPEPANRDRQLDLGLASEAPPPLLDPIDAVLDDSLPASELARPVINDFDPQPDATPSPEELGPANALNRPNAGGVDPTVDAMVDNRMDVMVTDPEPREQASPSLSLPDLNAPESASDALRPDRTTPPTGLKLDTPALDGHEDAGSGALALDHGSDWADPLDDSSDYLRREGPRRTRQELPVAGILIVALVVASLLTYVFRDNLFANLSNRGATPVAAEPSDASAQTARAPEPVAQPQPAEEHTPVASQGDRAVPSLTVPPPAAASPSQQPPARTTATGGELPVVGSPPPPIETAPVVSVVPEPAPSEPRSGPAFTRVADVTWHPATRGGTVRISTDGEVREGRFRYFRLEGKSPREVIVITGVTGPFGRPAIAIDSPIVAGLRTGYHRKNGGNEVHIVVDLADPEAKITACRAVGRRLEVDIQLP